MPSHLNEMENEGIILIGRPVRTEFKSTEEIDAAAKAVDALAMKHGLPLGFVYAGTTINWPDEFEYTPCLIGLVTHVDYGSDDVEPNPLPRSALAPREIPEEVWAALRDEHGIELEEETGTYLTVAGWTRTAIDGADGERILGVSAEDNGYVRIDSEPRLMEGDEPLQMRTSYC